MKSKDSDMSELKRKIKNYATFYEAFFEDLVMNPKTHDLDLKALNSEKEITVELIYKLAQGYWCNQNLVWWWNDPETEKVTDPQRKFHAKLLRESQRKDSETWLYKKIEETIGKLKIKFKELHEHG